MPSAPGASSATDAAKKRKEAESEEKKKRKDFKDHKVDPSTVEEVVEGAQVESRWFNEGDWKPAWGNVEFVRFATKPATCFLSTLSKFGRND